MPDPAIPTPVNRLWFWLTHNASSSLNRWMMRYLQRRGWVVFYLEPECRECLNYETCWMRLYEAGRK